MRKRSLSPFGVMIKESLRKKQMSQVKLASEVGTSKQYLDMILHGERSGEKYRDKIIEICEIDID